MKRTRTWIATLLLAALAGCGDDDGGPMEMTEPPPALHDLTVHFTGIDQAVPPLPPEGRPITAWIVDNDTDAYIAIGMYRDYPWRDFTMEMPNSIPDDANLRLDVWIDANANNNCDGIGGSEKSWRHQLDENTANEIDRPVNTGSELYLPCPVPGTGLNCWVTMTGMTPHLGQQLELRVTETETSRTLGYYFVDSLATDTFLLIVPNVLAPNTEYQVDFYADLNGNAAYDPPPTDHAWRVIQSSNQIGLDIQFNHNTEFTDIQF